MKEISNLPNITGANPGKIADFCDKLTHSVQALETMGKLSVEFVVVAIYFISSAVYKTHIPCGSIQQQLNFILH